MNNTQQMGRWEYYRYHWQPNKVNAVAALLTLLVLVLGMVNG